MSAHSVLHNSYILYIMLLHHIHVCWVAVETNVPLEQASNLIYSCFSSYSKTLNLPIQLLNQTTASRIRSEYI